ncbi:Hypothetical protein R9X50_00305000 [Acrodontium crateriforme]|uniref:Actin-like ATPase domain-containing protein n=1 Tax=Acrodontium crateriforme TaxID=150365 RepID=A0AAQ3M8B2_9PEZI|nr:Hypothetical protein R9X50_00305000 [Acrodontium crateriforme]
MAASNPSSDYFSSRPSIRTRPSPSVGGAGGPLSPRSPRTPLLSRSINAQFGSPGSFRTEPEDQVVYELGARHLSAGFAGESRPRCILRFDPDNGARVGDYRVYEPFHQKPIRKVENYEAWGQDYELYRSNLKRLDLGLVEDRLERAVRTAHSEHLQLDSKTRKAVLAVPSLLPTPLLDVALKVIFHHFPQPPSITLLTTPILACVGAGLRHALVVDIGWEETVITVVGEYKEIFQRRSVRAGKMLSKAMAKTLEHGMHGESRSDEQFVDFQFAEDVTERVGWCRPRSKPEEKSSTQLRIPLPGGFPHETTSVSFENLSDPAEEVFFSSCVTTNDQDDEDLPVHHLAHRVLLAVPLELRAICLSRVVVTGGVSQLPGLKQRLLQELAGLSETRGWDPVHSYGSAAAARTKALQQRKSNLNMRPVAPTTPMDEENPQVTFSPAKKPIQDSIPHSERLQDDVKDPVTLKAEREAKKGQQEVIRGDIRGVETVGAWAAASLVAGLRVKGVHEIERDDFLKHGHWDGGAII